MIYDGPPSPSFDKTKFITVYVKEGMNGKFHLLNIEKSATCKELFCAIGKKVYKKEDYLIKYKAQVYLSGHQLHAYEEPMSRYGVIDEVSLQCFKSMRNL